MSTSCAASAISIVSGAEQERVFRAAQELAKAAPGRDDVLVLGPAPAPMSLLRGRYRYRFLINARRNVQLQAIVRRWLGEIGHPPGVRVGVDIDPYSFV